MDASTAVQASLAQGGFAPLDGHELVAPALLWFEAVSALHELSWRRTVPSSVAAEALDRLLEAPITRRDEPEARRTAWRIAEELGWAKTYDAEYVALAQLLDCRLVTVDERLLRGAAHLVTVVAPVDVWRCVDPRWSLRSLAIVGW